MQKTAETLGHRLRFPSREIPFIFHILQGLLSSALQGYRGILKPSLQCACVPGMVVEQGTVNSDLKDGMEWGAHYCLRPLVGGLWGRCLQLCPFPLPLTPGCVDPREGGSQDGDDGLSYRRS